MWNKKIRNLTQKIGLTEIFIFAIICFIIIFVLLYFSRTKKWLVVDMKVTTNNVLYSNQNIPFWLITTLKQGDKELDGLGQPSVEVFDIKTYETPDYYKEAYVKLKIKVVYNKAQNKYTFASKDLFIGGPISVKPRGVLLEGVVTAIEGISSVKKEVHKKVRVQLEDKDSKREITSGIKPWMAEAIKVGDEIKDFNGKTIAKVLEKRAEPALRITVDDRGNPHLVRDPLLQDVYLVLDLLTVEDKGIYYFRDTEKVKINNQISLFTEKFDVKPVIIEILE